MRSLAVIAVFLTGAALATPPVVPYTEGLKKLIIEQDTAAAVSVFRALAASDTLYAPAFDAAARLGVEPLRYSRRAYLLDSMDKWYAESYARNLVQAERYADASRVYGRLTRLDPQNPDNFRLLAALYQAQGRMGEAIELLDSAEVRFGEHPLITAMRRQMLVQQAEALNEQGDMRGYIAISRRLFADPEIESEDKLRIFRALAAKRNVYRENYFQMGELAATLVLQDPASAEAVELYATHLLMGGDLEQALLFYKKNLFAQRVYQAVIELETYLKRVDSVDLYAAQAIERYPAVQEFRLARGHARAYVGRNAEAIDDYRAALKQIHGDSLRGAVWGHIGDAYYQLNDMPSVWGAYDRALRFRRDNALVLNNYAYFLAELADPTAKQLGRALRMAEAAVELDGDNATYHDTRAWVLYRKGDLSAARREMQQAISLDGAQTPELLHHYADILKAAGEEFMAEVYYKKAGVLP